jgi:hypothetical protein
MGSSQRCAIICIIVSCSFDLTLCSLEQLEAVELYEVNRCGEVKNRVENKELRDGHERITGVIAAAAAAAAADAAAAAATTAVAVVAVVAAAAAAVVAAAAAAAAAAAVYFFIVTFRQPSTAWVRSSRC